MPDMTNWLFQDNACIASNLLFFDISTVTRSVSVQIPPSRAVMCLPIAEWGNGIDHSEILRRYLAGTVIWNYSVEKEGITGDLGAYVIALF